MLRILLLVTTFIFFIASFSLASQGPSAASNGFDEDVDQDDDEKGDQRLGQTPEEMYGEDSYGGGGGGGYGCVTQII